jgi:hypothetical protein
MIIFVIFIIFISVTQITIIERMSNILFKKSLIVDSAFNIDLLQNSVVFPKENHKLILLDNHEFTIICYRKKNKYITLKYERKKK